jgi:hypothetical protein
MPYQSTDAQKAKLDALMQMQSGTGSGLANAIRMLAAKRSMKQLEQQEAANDLNQQRELAMMLRGQQTGRVGESYASRPADQFVPTDPELRQITAKLLMERATGTSTPSNVREWEYFSKLPSSQQEQYLTMRRGTSPINLGDQFVIPSAVNPAGAPRASFDVGLRPQDTPEVRGDQEAARQQAVTEAIPDQMAAETQGLLERSSAQTQQTRSRDAMGTLEILDMAEPLLDVATGSGAGAARDTLGALFGWSGDGAEAAAQLATLSGQLIMKMPRMEGPQSNMDQQLYREMAGKIGDPTIPNDVRKAALQTIREINQKYAGSAAPAATRRFRYNVATGELE